MGRRIGFETVSIKGPFTTVCPACNSHWGGKRTCTVYDISSMRKVCSVPSYPHRSKEEALRLTEIIAEVLNKETVNA